MQIQTLGIDNYDAMMDLWQRSGLSSVRPRGRDSREAFTRLLAKGASVKERYNLQTVLGLLEDDQLVGIVIASHDGRKGWINRLAVDPGHRRQGYATQLIMAAEQLLQADGIRIIAALIECENEASLALFQHAGYQLSDRVCYLSKRESAEA